MRLLLSVARGADGELVDVAVTCEETATVADLARHLKAAFAPRAAPVARVRDTGRRLGLVVDVRDDEEHSPAQSAAASAAVLATTSAPRLYLGPRALDPDQLVADSPVRNGAILGLGDPPDTTTDEPAGVVEVRVVSGPGAGTVRRLGIGNHRIGPGPDASVHLPHGPTLSLDVAPDAAVRIHPPDEPGEPVPAPMRREPLDGPIVVPRGNTGAPATTAGRSRTRAAQALDARFETIDPTTDRAGVELDRMLLTGAQDWAPGVCLSVGASLLELRVPTRPDASLSRSPAGATLDYNRPPRLRPAPRATEFTLPAEPNKPPRSPLPFVLVLAPLVMGGVMFALTRQVYTLALMGLSPVLLLGSWWQGRRTQRSSYADTVAQYRAKKARVEEAAFDALQAERGARRVDAPDPAEVLLQATGPRARLWERRLTDPDWLTVRIGTADLPSEVVLTDPSRDHHRGALTWTAPDVPATVSIAAAGVLGVAGRGDTARGLGRWILAQVATLHSPADLRVVVISPGTEPTAWAWTRWLPHVRGTDDGAPARVGADADTTASRVAELVAELEARRAVAAARSGATHTPVLVVLDGARALRLLPGMVTLLREGPALGIAFVCLDADVTLLPEECRAVVSHTGDTVRVEVTGQRLAEAVRPDLVSTAWCERLARALAPVRDVSAAGAAATIPTRSRLLTVLDLETPEPAAITARWAGGGRTTTAVIGETADGPFTVDLRRDGPHGLVAGTTGSGKSELLQTLIASLAVGNRPDEMTFVLIDYKGGAAFKDCASLPHTVGMVTDLDAHLTTRALESLAAELRRREHQLADLGAKDIEDYLAARRPADEPMPRLLIVIDEFAALVAELPDFVTGLVDIARRGRSLGVHLLLATQRPAGVVNAEIKSNTNLRIALRVTDRTDSQDVIEAPDAAEIPPALPGRAYARLGHSSLVAFQSARVGGRPPTPGTAASIDVAPLTWAAIGRPAPTRQNAEDDGDAPTDLATLVTAVRDAAHAAGIEAPPSPWLPALPTTITLDDLPDADAHRPTPHLALPLGLVDLPALQRRDTLVYDLARDGNLAVVGSARSGRSTALRALAAAVGRRTSPRDVHLYGVDCGNNALLPLVALPHTGAVVTRDQPDRLARLTRRLRTEISRRQQLLATSAYADAAEQRAAAPAGERLPYLLVLLDRWEGFMQAFEDYDAGALLDLWIQILQEGPGVGIKVVVSGDRSLLVGRISTLTEDRIMLRMTEPGDYQSVGLSARDLPDSIPDGRAFTSTGAQELQIALLGPDPSGPAQVAALQAIARDVTTRAHRAADAAPADQVPFRVDQLPARVALTDALALPGPALPATSVPAGVGGDTLALLGLDAEDHGPGLLVSGPRRSGRSTTLTMMGTHALDHGWAVGTITPRRSPLRDLDGRPGHHGSITADTPRQEVVDFLAGLVPVDARPTLLLVDDLEILGTDGPLADALVDHLRALRDKPGMIIAAGTGEELTGAYRGPAAALKKSRSGIILCPAAPGDGEILGVRLPRSALGATAPGRGLHVTPTGWQQIQVPTP